VSTGEKMNPLPRDGIMAGCKRLLAAERRRR
jgi:hypothetical protein